jgi:RecA/RadA recombinase
VVIIENKFTVKLGKSVINEFSYEVSRSEEITDEVLLRSTTKNGNREQVSVFKTDKTDEEIVVFYNQKYEEYEQKIDKAWFFLKSVPIVKFSKEFELFFGKPITK